MLVTAHLRELQRRLIICVLASGVGFAIAYYFSAGLYKFLAKPLLQALPPGEDFMIFTGIVEPFFVYLKVGLLGGILIASPVILYEIWAFIAPGLYRDEKSLFLPAVISSSVLFALGAAFAYAVVFPFGFKYLLGYSDQGLKPMLSMGLYFSMAMRLLLAFGAVFQLPLVLLVLARLGMVTAKKLISWWRYALVLILLVSAVLTPSPDVFNQLLMAAPLIVLYAAGVILAAIFGKKIEAAEEVDEETLPTIDCKS